MPEETFIIDKLVKRRRGWAFSRHGSWVNRCWVPETATDTHFRRIDPLREIGHRNTQALRDKAGINPNLETRRRGGNYARG